MAEHTVFVCVHWATARMDVERHFGREMSPDDVKDLLCGPAINTIHKKGTTAVLGRMVEGRRTFVVMVRNVIGEKEEDERNRQRRGRRGNR